MPPAQRWPASSRERVSFIADAARRAFVLHDVPNLAAAPALFVRRPWSVYVAADPPAHNVELHAVGVAETPRSDDRSALPVVRITVRRGEKPIALLLMTYHAAQWELRVEPGAQLAGILLSCHEPSVVRCPVPLGGILPLHGAPQISRFDPAGFGEDSGPQVLRRIRAVTGIELTSFQGQPYGARFTVPPYRDPALVREVIAAHRKALRAYRARTPDPFGCVDDPERTDDGTLPAQDDPSASEEPDEYDGPPYEGSVSVDQLRRDADTIIRQVAATGQPLLLLASGYGFAMLASYERYLGQLSSLDETRFDDWRQRLERARGEIGASAVAPVVGPSGWPCPPNLAWTPQAADDLRSALAEERDKSRLQYLLLAGAVPMDGPYAGYWCSTSALGWRTIFQKRDERIWIAYIRRGVKHIWGPLVEDPQSQ